MFLKTYYSEFNEEGVEETLHQKLGYHFEIVEDYTSVVDLQKYGDTVGYGEEELDDEGKPTGGYTVYSTKDYIHFINDRGANRQSLTLEIPDKECQGKTIKENYKVRYGTSYLETAREAYKIVDLIESIILSVRFGRSALYRLFKVEVGGASKAETAKILREFKQKLSQATSIDVKNNNFYSAKKPVPYGQNVYIPTRNGKGDVSHELVGGDVDIKELVDIEYFRNKLFAALKIPKAFLGFEEAMPGGIGNQSLTRIDIRYARTVKRVKKILKAGVKDMLEFYCRVNGKENWIDLFDVEMAKITTADETDKRDEILTDIQLAESLKGLVADIDSLDKEALIKCIFSDILNMDDLYKILFPDGITEVEVTPMDGGDFGNGDGQE